MAYGESNGHVIDDVTRSVASGRSCVRLTEVEPCERFLVFIGLWLMYNTHRRRRQDSTEKNNSTVELSRVGGVYGIRN